MIFIVIQYRFNRLHWCIEYTSVQTILIYDTGSVDDSIIYELLQRNLEIYLTWRSVESANQKVSKWDSNVYNGESYDVFINATPLSLSHLNEDIIEILEKGNRIFDLVVKKDAYLEKYCINTGKSFISGFEMYKYQFCSQFKLYTEIEINPSFIEEIAKTNKLI